MVHHQAGGTDLTRIAYRDRPEQHAGNVDASRFEDTVHRKFDAGYPDILAGARNEKTEVGMPAAQRMQKLRFVLDAAVHADNLLDDIPRQELEHVLPGVVACDPEFLAAVDVAEID